MKKLSEFVKTVTSQSAYTLLELLVVLSITAIMMSLVAYGVVKFRQVIIASNTTKELTLQLRKARRYAINNVVTSSGISTSGYYIYINNNEYYWGECTEISCTHSSDSIKSNEYSGTNVSLCKDSGGTTYSRVKFDHVTGKFLVYKDDTDFNNDNPTDISSCEIEVEIPGVVNTKRKIEVSITNRTIKME
ncbi:Tfp pilus assembly protein FimT/FimU [Patescibacteria group bacterium]